MSDRIRRILAFMTDWIITLFPFVLISMLFPGAQETQSEIHPVLGILVSLFILTPFILFVLRDVIWKGRSIGKRIFGLWICDKNTLEDASPKQRFVRNIFLFIYPVDCVILLVTGDTIGDSAAKTVVLSKKSLEQRKTTHTDHAPSAPAVRRKANLREIIAVIVVVVGLFLATFCITLLVLNAQKDSEEYQLAYAYLVSSDAFAEMNTEESRIWMNQYSSHTYSSADSDSVTQTVEIGFLVKGKSFQVVCHRENDFWQICRECTPFQ